MNHQSKVEMMDEGKKNGNRQAFLDEGPYSRGLTKREEFAKSAMRGLLANPSRSGTIAEFVDDAISYADALLAELAKTEVG